MWRKKSRRIAELEDRVRQLVDERDDARTASAVNLAAAVRTAGRNTALAERIEQLATTEASHDADLGVQADRIERLLRGCIRYRADLSTSERDNRRLQGLLDDALGLSHPVITAGVDWQKRRPDKKEGSLT
ncbi:hypothetical protein AB0H77_15500 [Streptomyces sp. NPDC050844]|uniref:hypothetical protein n=1 Tax=Streptomyces sp. NPDC050844 TaxID=3155790 RepID=UPI0033C4320D